MQPNKAVHPLLNYYQTIAKKQTGRDKRGVRYTTQEKDIGVYEYMLGGRSLHAFHGANRPVISRSTVIRHLRRNTEEMSEGEPSMTTIHYSI